jgi:hypothetical protein
MRRARKRRLAALALVALAPAPGTFVRTEVVENRKQNLRVEPLTVDLPARTGNGFQRVGLWELNSPHTEFGGYSALLALGAGLRAFSDRGAGTPDIREARHGCGAAAEILDRLAVEPLRILAARSRSGHPRSAQR